MHAQLNECVLPQFVQFTFWLHVLCECHADRRLPLGGSTPFLHCPEACRRVQLCVARARRLFLWHPERSVFGGFHCTLAALGKSGVLWACSGPEWCLAGYRALRSPDRMWLVCGGCACRDE